MPSGGALVIQSECFIALFCCRMATYKAAALLLLATFAFGAYANDLILSFKVVDCYGK